MGKTYLLARLCQLLEPESISDDSAQGGSVAFLCYQADAFNKVSLRKQITEDLVGLAGVPDSEVSETVLPRFVRRFEHRCVIAIDALNTSPDPQTLLRDLRSLSAECGESLRVVVTCQPSAWMTLLQSVGGPEHSTPTLSIGQYSDQEAQNAIGLLADSSASDVATVVQKWSVRDPLLVGLVGRHMFCGNRSDSDKLMTDGGFPALLEHLQREHGLRHEDIQFLSQGLAAAILSLATGRSPTGLAQAQAGHVALSAFTERDRAAIVRLDTFGIVRIRYNEAGFSHERLRDYFLGQGLLQQRAIDAEPNTFYPRTLDELVKSESRLVLQGAVRDAILADLALAHDASLFVDMAFVDPDLEMFLIATFQLSARHATRLHLPLRILDRAMSELTRARLGRPSPVHAGNSRSPEIMSVSGARVALEVAQHLADDKTLEKGLSCPDIRVRAVAVQAVSRLSRQDWGKGAAVVRQTLLIGWHFGLLPEKVKSCAALSVLLMAELPHSKDARRREGIAALRDIWMGCLRRVPRFARGWILDRMIEMFKERTTEGGRYNPVNFRELSQTFLLSSQDMASYMRLVDALGATTVNMAKVKDDVCAATSRRDAISAFVVGALFARQFLDDPGIGLQIAEAVAAIESAQNRKIGPSMTQIVWGLYVALRARGFTNTELLASLNSYITRYFSASPQGDWQAASDDVYSATFSDIRIICAVEVDGDAINADLQHLLKRAVKEHRDHPDLIRDILYDLSKVSRDRKYQSALLANLEWLLAQSAVNDIEALTDILATMRQENSVLVDQTLRLWNVPSDRVDRIMSRSVLQSIGEDLMFGNVSLGFGDLTTAWYLDEGLRPMLIRILRSVADGRGLVRWCAHGIAALANAALDAPYFPETKA
jgi:hypothetical protein